MKISTLFEKTNDYTIYLDLDGVMADIISGVSKAYNEIFDDGESFSQTKYDNNYEYRKKMWKSITEYQKKNGYTFWYDLKLLPDAKELWNFVHKHFDKVEILSATGHAKHKADNQKRKWVKKHLSKSIKVNLVPRGDAKSDQFGKENRILIDDRSKTKEQWEKAGGIGIIHKNTTDTISQLKKLL